ADGVVVLATGQAREARGARNAGHTDLRIDSGHGPGVGPRLRPAHPGAGPGAVATDTRCPAAIGGPLTVVPSVHPQVSAAACQEEARDHDRSRPRVHTQFLAASLRTGRRRGPALNPQRASVYEPKA